MIYRYTLERRTAAALFSAPRVLLWVMLNPSIADQTREDQTSRKVTGFTERWGFTHLRVVNLFAYRATKPIALWGRLAEGFDVVGPDNDATIRAEVAAAHAVVCAWGSLHRRPAQTRRNEVLRMLLESQHNDLLCIARNIDGEPTHPCMTPYTNSPAVWKHRGATTEARP